MLLLLLVGCGDALDTGLAAVEPIVVVDMASYLRACEATLGPMPVIDCQAGVEIPITVTDEQGVRTVNHSSELEDGRCDAPSVAGCGWGSSLGVAYNEQGTPWVYTCRNYNDDPAIDQINLIAVHPETGQSCFVSTKHRDDEFGLGGSLPRPGSAEDLAWFPDRSFWYTLEDLGRASCVVCHDNGPIILNPWIGQPGILPQLSAALPFRVVAQAELIELNPEWALPAQITHPSAAPCLQCHTLGQGRSCVLALEATGRRGAQRSQATRSGYPQSRWMPHMDQADLLQSYPTEADWEQAFGLAADTLELCCSEDPPADCY